MTEAAKNARDTASEHDGLAGGRPRHMSAEGVISGVVRQMSGLESLSERLERTLGASICNCQEISSETIQSLQSADFIRQSVKDMRAILGEIAPHVCWREGTGIDLDDLRRAVDMHASFTGLDAGVQSDATEPEHDIWF